MEHVQKILTSGTPPGKDARDETLDQPGDRCTNAGIGGSPRKDEDGIGPSIDQVIVAKKPEPGDANCDNPEYW